MVRVRIESAQTFDKRQSIPLNAIPSYHSGENQFNNQGRIGPAINIGSNFFRKAATWGPDSGGPTGRSIRRCSSYGESGAIGIALSGSCLQVSKQKHHRETIG